MKTKIFLRSAALAAALLAISACSSVSGDPAKDAQAALAAHDYEAAKIHLANARDANPGDAAITFLSGKIALQMGNVDLAQTELAALLDHPQHGKDARALLAKAKILAGNPQEALTLLAEGGGADSALAMASEVLAMLALGKSDEADTRLAAALARFPESPDLGVIAGANEIGAGDLDAAHARAQAMIAAHPDSPDVLLFAGRAALALRKLDVAKTHLDKLLKMLPNHQAGLLAMASIARDSGDGKQAEAHLAKASQSAQGNHFTRAMQAQIALESNDFAKAEKLLRGTETAWDEIPSLALMSGLVASKRDQHEQVVAALGQYFATGGEDMRGRVAYARSLVAVGDPHKAWAILKPAAEAANANAAVTAFAAKLTQTLGDPSSAKYVAKLGSAGGEDPIAKPMKQADAAIAAGNWQKADSIYAQLLPSHGNNVILLNNAANARLELGDAAGAVALARRALAVAPTDPIVLDTLGWSLFKAQGDSPEVRKLLGQAIAAMPGNPEIQAHVNAVVNASGRKS